MEARPQFRQVARLGQHPAVLVLHPEVHEAVGVEVLRAEALHGQLEAHPLLDETLQRAHQGLVAVQLAGVEQGHEVRRALRNGLESVVVPSASWRMSWSRVRWSSLGWAFSAPLRQASKLARSATSAGILAS